jgi:hypothetical protein
MIEKNMISCYDNTYLNVKNFLLPIKFMFGNFEQGVFVGPAFDINYIIIQNMEIFFEKKFKNSWNVENYTNVMLSGQFQAARSNS